MKKRIIVLTMLTCMLQIQNLYSSVPDQTILANRLKEARQAWRNQQGKASGTSETPAAGTDCSQCPSTCDTTTVTLPPLVISLYDATGTVINTYTFPTSTSFMTSYAILDVHIFPPSNTVPSSKSVTYVNKKTDSYAIIYSLKSTNGTMLQKAMQYGPPSGTPLNPSPAISPGQFPAAISVSSNSTATPPVTTALLATSPSPFLPTAFGSSPAGTQQQIINGISPMSQKFLINNSGTLAAIPISGMFDTQDGTTLSSSVSSSTIQPGGTLPALSMTLADSSSNSSAFNFGGTSSIFGSSDLQNGLIFNLHIFPPSFGSVAGSSASYILVGTLRSLDGLKLHKQILTAASTTPVATFSPVPTLFNVTQGSSSNPTTLLATSILNTATTAHALNVISPLNIRCLIQQPTGSQNITASTF